MVFPNPYNTLASRSRRELRATRAPTLSDIGNMMDQERAQRPIDAAKAAQLIVQAGDRARSGAQVRLPAKGSAARLILEAGAKARNEKLPNDD
jgi:hypothetical protein